MKNARQIHISLSGIARRKGLRSRLIKGALTGIALLAMLLLAGPSWAGSLSWTEVAGLPAARYALAAGVLNDALYAIGGANAGGHETNNVYRFDGTNWTEVAGLPAARGGLAAGVLNGALYAVGGADSDATQTNVYRYDGVTWTEVAGLPEARCLLAAGVLNDGIYAVGGIDSDDNVTTNVYRFDGTNWMEVAGLPAARRSLAVGVVNNALYAIGGRDAYSSTTNVYHFDGSTWTEVAGLPAARYASAAGVLNDALYVAVGFYTNVYRFDGSVWTEVAGLPVARSSMASGVLNGALYVVGGFYGGVGASTNVYCFEGARNLRILGTNYATIVSGEAANVEKGTDFGAFQWGMARTNILSLINTGAGPVTISAVLTNGSASSIFRVLNVPGQIESDATSTFSVVFAPASGQTYTAQVSIFNNGGPSPYILNVRGTGESCDQSITFFAISDQTITNTVGLSATASSGLPVSFSVGSGPAQISNGTNLSFTSTGVVCIIASQAGNSNWYAAPSVTNSFTVTGVSTSSAAISSGVCVDYDGDGKADPSVYDEATGTWRVRLSIANYYLVTTTLNGLGGRGWASVAADYDGDRKADPAVYQELTGTWMVLLSTANYTVKVELSQFLGGIGYSAMPADYDGDAKADPGVYQRARGDWKVMLSSSDYSTVELLGLLGGTGYRAVAADYDGDGKADPAIYGESNGVWAFKLSGANYLAIILAQTLGGAGYLPVPADYDGDGLADPAVKSESGNEWIVMFSASDYTPVHLTILFE